MNLWYTRPAAAWDEALPLGNGKLGAMLWGDSQVERLDLNESTLWSGFPRDTLKYDAQMYLEPVRAMLRKECYYEAQALIERELQRRSPEAYQPLGTLTLETLNDSEPSSYRRARDLETATFTVATDTAQRGAFISYPDTCWLTAG